MAHDPEADARISFQETCEMARHYGKMRFAFATFFTVIIGWLLRVDIEQHTDLMSPS